MWNTLSDPQVLQAIGERVRELRLERQLSQAELARHAGISLPTMQRLEAARGKSSAASLIRILRSLRKLDALEAVFAPPSISPMALAGKQKPKRQRAPRKTISRSGREAAEP